MSGTKSYKKGNIMFIFKSAYDEIQKYSKLCEAVHHNTYKCRFVLQRNCKESHGVSE